MSCRKRRCDVPSLVDWFEQRCCYVKRQTKCLCACNQVLYGVASVHPSRWKQITSENILLLFFCANLAKFCTPSQPNSAVSGLVQLVSPKAFDLRTESGQLDCAAPHEHTAAQPVVRRHISAVLPEGTWGGGGGGAGGRVCRTTRSRQTRTASRCINPQRYRGRSGEMDAIPVFFSGISHGIIG